MRDELVANEMLSSDDDMNAEEMPAERRPDENKKKTLHNVPKVSGMNFSQLKQILSLKNRANIPSGQWSTTKIMPSAILQKNGTSPTLKAGKKL